MKAVIAIDSNSITVTREEESLWIKSHLIEECDTEWTFVDIEPWEIFRAPNAAAYVVDFGGLGVGWSTSRADQCVSELVKAIENKPGRLFMIWSAHTVSWYRGEITKDLESASSEKIPDNVVLYGDPKAWDKVRAWLGVNKPTDLEASQAYRDVINELDVFASSSRACHALIDSLDDIASSEDGGDQEEVQDVEADLCVPPASDEGSCNEEAIEQIVQHVGQATVQTGGEPQVGPIKEPIAIIQIPLYCQHRPGQTFGSANFKMADCIVDVSDDNDKKLGHLGGTFFGSYEISYPAEDRSGELYVYEMRPKDIWEAMQPIHDRFKRENQQAQAARPQSECSSTKLQNRDGGSNEDHSADIGDVGDPGQAP